MTKKNFFAASPNKFEVICVYISTGDVFIISIIPTNLHLDCVHKLSLILFITVSRVLNPDPGSVYWKNHGNYIYSHR